MKHYIHPALLAADGHQVTVDLLGCGGTGSSLLTHLARLHLSLVARGHLGLHVRVFDPDLVEEPNLVRQHFTRSDLGRNKATVAVERLNRFYGLSWQAIPLAWDANWVKQPIGPFAFANITVSCVDTVKARHTLYNQVRLAFPNYHGCFTEDGSISTSKTRNPVYLPLYWLDLGNARDVGQVMLSTFFEIPQPWSYGNDYNWKSKKDCVPPLRRLHPGHKPEKVISNDWQGQLPTLFDNYGDLEEFEDDAQTPSCSLIESLAKQSIMVNPMMAVAGANLLSQLFEQTQLDYHGCFINLRTLSTVPIKVPQHVHETYNNLKLAFA